MKTQIDLNKILQFKEIITKTRLQEGYQEQTKLFRLLKNHLQKELKGYAFTGNIVENNMDYAYFQFADENLKAKGLKFVVVFLYKDFQYELWLSGYNRKIQSDMYNKFAKMKNLQFALTANPLRTDYVLKQRFDCNFNDFEDFDRSLEAFTREARLIIENIIKELSKAS